MNNFKKKHYILGGILLVMLITNPSVKNLREQIDNPNGRVIKRFNGLVFSIYNKKTVETVRWKEITYDDTYIGILGNCIKL